MPAKRKYSNKKRVMAAKYGTSVRNVNSAAIDIQRIVKAAVSKQTQKYIETKRSNVNSTDNITIAHNSFVYCDSNVLITTPGTSDPNTGNQSNRIGDEINLKGVAMKFMLENNHRFSDVTFRILVVRSAKGDVPTSATLFNGLSGNKMMDTINTERYSIVHSKYVKVKQGNSGSDGTLAASYVGSGLFDGDAGLTQSASTRIVQFYIPGYKFVGKKGIVRYENGTSQVKFFDYTVLVYAYAVGATSEALSYSVGVLNEYVKVMYFKDA